MAPNAIDSLWSAKFAKSVTGAGAPWNTVLGHELELVPLADPATARPGETLRVRVLFRGQPLAGAEVERGDGLTPMKEDELPRFKTDADGVATIPLPKAGPSCSPSTIVWRLRKRPTWRPRTFTTLRYGSPCAGAELRLRTTPCDRRNFGGRPAIDLPRFGPELANRLGSRMRMRLSRARLQ